MICMSRWAVGLWIGSLSLTCAIAAPVPRHDLPPGLSVIQTEKGIALSMGGMPLYSLDLDRLGKRFRDPIDVPAERCAQESCMRYWHPVAAPAAFMPTGDWSVVQKPSGVQLAYKGSPLYRFAGKSLDELAQSRVAPPYFSSYTSPGINMLSGVPVSAIFWRVAIYQQAIPAFTAPAGINADLSRLAAPLTDTDGRKLYVRKSSKPCKDGCDGFKPLSAPLASEPVGQWRPEPGESGGLEWHYGGKTVYAAPRTLMDGPHADWRALTAG